MTVLLMADYGVALYGNAIIVNTDFAKANPAAVTGFLRAVAKGWKDSVADPAMAIESLIARNPAADPALEQRRLELALAGNVMTDWVKANGLGNIDPARFAKAIEQTKSVYTFTNAPDAALYFDPSYLPADGSLSMQ